jgi:hypothetical protein
MIRISQKSFPTEILQFLNWTKQLSWNVFSISHVDSLTQYVQQKSVDSQLVNVLNITTCQTRVVIINVDLQLLATSLQFGCFTLILKKPEYTGYI